MKKILGLCAVALIPATQAASVTIPILDVGTFAAYSVPAGTETYNGTGYYGMHTEGLVHLFGAEIETHTRTIAMVDLGFLNGADVLSASLSFTFLDGGGTQNLQLTGFADNGTLNHLWDAPGTFIDQDLYTVSLGANTLDVTDLIDAAAAGDVDWLGLHIKGTTEFLWTYTGNHFTEGRDADSALVRLNIEFNEANPVPEVQHYAGMLGAVIAGAEMLRRRRKS